MVKAARKMVSLIQEITVLFLDNRICALAWIFSGLALPANIPGFHSKTFW